ncbi:MAG: hypothetical protein GC145_18455 [Caulobacter sp.]|nr:hypothetical protein [Caulobacter sp.]
MNRTIGPPRLWAALTACAGVLVLAVTVAFRLLPEVSEAAGCMSEGAVVEFELARTLDALQTIFGLPSDSCRPAVIAAMDAVNHLDVFAYIPVYTAFALCAALFLSGARLSPLALAAIGLALVALAADYVETLTLLAITPGIERNLGLAPIASTAAGIKFGALAAHAMALAAICLEARPRRWILAILLLAAPLGFVAAASDPLRLPMLTLGLTVAWAPIMALAVWRALRPGPLRA